MAPIQGNREAEVLRGRLPTASRDFDQFVQHHVRLTSVLAGRLRLFVGLNTACLLYTSDAADDA